MCMCEYIDSPVSCDECVDDSNSVVPTIGIGTEVFVDHPKYDVPVWAKVESIDEETGEVFCVGDDGEEYFANSINDLVIYPS